jgi:acetyl esterase/lipase
MDHLFEPRHAQGRTQLEILRTLFGWASVDMSRGVGTKRICVESPWGPVVCWAYEKETPAPVKDRPGLVFFHGGGFFAGSIATVENQCRLIAQRAGALVLSVDYPLAPENPYPIGFDCCYAVLEWAARNAGPLGIDGGKIALAGDSAGGNLALCCALRSRDSGGPPVAYQALIYPVLSRAEGPEDPHWYWTGDIYDNPDRDPLIEEQILAIQKLSPPMNRWYLPPESGRFLPYASPITAAPEGLPTTLMLTAEYDFLRAECEEYSRMLARAGVENRHIRYGGITHGTFDRLGYAPQAEDMVNEIVKDLENLKKLS